MTYKTEKHWSLDINNFISFISRNIRKSPIDSLRKEEILWTIMSYFRNSRRKKRDSSIYNSLFKKRLKQTGVLVNLCRGKKKKTMNKVPTKPRLN